MEEMNVLSPELMWIDGRCYRVNQSNVTDNQKAPAAGYREEDLYGEDEDDEDSQYFVEYCSAGRYKHSFHVNKMFFGLIIGQRGSVRTRLEKETNTRINIPKMGQDGDITITGSMRKDVLACRKRINLIVMGGKQKLGFTHFVCIPCNTEEVVRNVEKFKDEILSNKNIQVDESAFISPQKVHQTVVPIALLDNEDRTKATECLQQCKVKIIDPFIARHPGKLKFKLQGLEILNDDPSAVSVLYARLENPEIQELCNQILQMFVKFDLTNSRQDQVKMHVTLINTRYQAQMMEEDRKKRPRITFDAREILKNYKDFEFGEVELKEFHLSIMGSTAENGFYQASSVIKV